MAAGTLLKLSVHGLQRLNSSFSLHSMGNTRVYRPLGRSILHFILVNMFENFFDNSGMSHGNFSSFVYVGIEGCYTIAIF